jgi:branched-chain amino acid transport system ATP-binding protein
LEVEKLTKSFGGIKAVADVDLGVESGMIHSIIGPNGSGKTTFFNLISGFYPPDSGTVVFRKETIDRKGPVERARLGIGRTFQTPKVAGELTVLENAMLGFNMHLHANVAETMFRLPRSRREENEVFERAMRIIRMTGLETIASVKAKNLPHGHLRMLEIARVMASEPRIILLDEPAAGLNHDEINHLEKNIRAIAETGCSVLLVEHHIGLVMRLAEKITVFDYGVKIAEGTPGEIQRSEEVMEAYLGSSIENGAEAAAL